LLCGGGVEATPAHKSEFVLSRMAEEVADFEAAIAAG
jgi:hypothetical protein